jgi:hypothetical protein
MEPVVYDSDGSVRACSLPQLVSMLCDPTCDPVFADIFYLTWPSVASSTALVDLIRAQFAAGQREQQRRVCSVLVNWIDAIPTPPQHVLDAGRSLAMAAAQRDLGADCSNALAAAVTRATRQLATLSQPRPGPSWFTSSADLASPSLESVDLLAVCETLCAEDGMLFGRIQNWELLDGAWAQPETKRSARNVRAIIARSNAVVRASLLSCSCSFSYCCLMLRVQTAWATHCVLSGEVPAIRAAAVTRLTHLCSLLRERNNFSSLVSVVTALSTRAVSRLARSWALVDAATTATLEEHKSVCSNSRSYRLYRVALAASQPPGVPFMCVIACLFVLFV